MQRVSNDDTKTTSKAGGSMGVNDYKRVWTSIFKLQERTGKTLTALLTVEASKAETCLVVTKKKAIPGWIDTLNEWEHTTTFTVINYESVARVMDKLEKGEISFE